MPINLNGSTFNNGGTITFNGTSLSAVYFGNTQVWQRSVTCTDLINWYGWSKSGNCNGVNSNGEDVTHYYTGIQILSGAPSAGLPNGKIWQSINMVNGHKYWLYFGEYTGDGMSIVTPLGNYSYRAQETTVSTVITYTGASGSQTVTVENTSSDVTASDYCRLCAMNIVDLTASFGSGHEPSAAWCDTNLGIFNGSKTVIPPT